MLAVVGILTPKPWLKVFNAWPGGGNEVGIPTEATAPPILVGTPILEPTPLKLKLLGFVIAEFILTVGVDVALNDRSGAVDVTNFGVDTPTLRVDVDIDEPADTETDGADIIGIPLIILSSQEYSTTHQRT
jgi:hypothetical protein